MAVRSNQGSPTSPTATSYLTDFAAVANGQAEYPVSVDAVRPGSNPKNSSLPRVDSKESFIDGPFGCKYKA